MDKSQNKKAYESFEAVSHYDRRGPRFEEKKVFDIIGQPRNNLILDLGCGSGRTTQIIKDLKKEVVGLDLSWSLLTKAKENNRELILVQADAARLPFKDNQFDVVLFSFNGLDYLFPESQRSDCLKEVYRVLKYGGVFLFSSHNANFVPNNFGRLVHLVKMKLNNRVGNYWTNPQPFGQLIEYHNSVTSQVLVLKKHGFKKIDIISQLPRWLISIQDPYPYYYCEK